MSAEKPFLLPVTCDDVLNKMGVNSEEIFKILVKAARPISPFLPNLANVVVNTASASHPDSTEAASDSEVGLNASSSSVFSGTLDSSGILDVMPEAAPPANEALVYTTGPGLFSPKGAVVTQQISALENPTSTI